MTSNYEDFALEQSRILREIQHKMRSQQLAEAWIGIETGQPLLTSIVPDGERSLLRKAVR
jgi:transcriptional regulator of met regulon